MKVTVCGLCLAVACATSLLASVPVTRQPASDGFAYPGKSAEAKRYNAKWDAYMRRLPAAKDDPELSEIEWMRGAWTAQPRDYPDSMTDPSKAELSPPSAATSDWTAGHRWLRLSFVAEPWHVEWNYFLGHDPVGKRWVLQYIASPSVMFAHPLTAGAWTGNRLVFSPVADTDKGFSEVSRFVIMRTSQDAFRIVSEVKMPSGRFVAMDDVLFTRRSVNL